MSGAWCGASRCSIAMAPCRPACLAGFLFGAEFLCIFFAFDYTSLGRGSLMINTMPFWVLIGAHFLLGERMSVAKVIGVVLAFAGVFVIFSDKLGAPGPDAWIGDLLTLSAGMLWAATSLVIKGSRLQQCERRKAAALPAGRGGSDERAAAAHFLARFSARFLPCSVGALLFPGDFRGCLHLSGLVLADAPLSGVGLGQLCLSDAGLLRFCSAGCCWTSR